MKKQLYIIGGGHAGSSAALSASRLKKDWNEEHIDIHLIDRSSYMTVKPRLYEYELQEVINPFLKFLPQAGVHFHQDEITKIDTEKNQIISKHKTYHYDAIIIALGSQVSNKWDIENVDSYKSATQFQEKWKALIDKSDSQTPIKIAILGAGFTGIELATEMPINFKKYAEEIKIQFPKIEVSLIGNGEIGAGLGENPKPEIQKALQQADINPISNAHIEKVEQNTVFYTQNGNEVWEKFDLVINTLGQKPNFLAKTLPLKKDREGRIEVDAHLNAEEAENIFVAGDMASVCVDKVGNKALMTCQQGRPQGRYAGYNALAYLLGRNMIAYSQPNYVTCLDLGAYGSLYTEGWDRQIRFKGREAKKFKQHINKERIYPPMTGNKEDLYKAGALKFRDLMETIKESRFNS